MTGREAKETLQRQYKNQNKHIKENYHRQTVTIKNDIYDRIKNKYGNISINGYINDLIKKDLDINE